MTANGVIRVPQVDLLDFGRRLKQAESSENDVSDHGSDATTTEPWLRATATHMLKCYDSATDGGARFAPHGSFLDPTVPEDAPLR